VMVASRVCVCEQRPVLIGGRGQDRSPYVFWRALDGPGLIFSFFFFSSPRKNEKRKTMACDWPSLERAIETDASK
jgi:hypothetical protein